MKKNILTSIVLILLFVTSCDFGDLNNNPNAPTSISNNPELLLTNICKTAPDYLVNTAWEEGNLMAQYFARIVFTNFDQFEWGSMSGFWSTMYRSIRNCNSLYEQGHNGYKAVALIMRAFAFQNLTEMYGEIPFSEAAKAKSANIYSPKYDTQEEVYNGIIKDLEEANNLLSQNPPAIKGDILNNNNLTKWRKLANSLLLRVLIRHTEAAPAKAQAKIAEIISNPSKYPIIESNADNSSLTYLSTPPNCYPRSAAMNYRIGSFNEFRMSETIQEVLQRFDDPRMKKWFSPTSNSVDSNKKDPKVPLRWDGMKNGMVDGNAYVYKGGAANLSAINQALFFDSPNSIKADVMTYAEVCFILAEAAQRGWIGDDAKTYYENGIKASFDYWGVHMPDDYYNRNGVKYDGKLETIITQKWLALFNTGYEGFKEFKRTGFPKEIKPGPDAFYKTYPCRFQYPDEEQTLNGANRQQALSRQGPDEHLTRLWYQKK